MKQVLFIQLILMLLLSLNPFKNQLKAQREPIMIKALDSLFQSRIANKKIAGVVCLISQNGKIIYHKSLGHQDIEEGILMQKTSLFNLQSMNKAILSLAALKLVDQGKINLDEPASKYLPELKDKKVGVLKNGTITDVPADKPITLRHLLSHSSGLGSSWNAGALESKYEKFESLPINNYKDAVKTYMQLPLIDHPGNGWYYGWGHLIMASIIEKVTGVPIQVYLAKEVFEPLAMTNTTFSLPKAKQQNMAQYYSVTEDGKLKKTLEDSTSTLETDMFSTTEDYHKFCQLLLNNGLINGKQFIRSELIKEFSKPTVGLNGEAIGFQKGYAFGLGVSVRVNNEKAEYKGNLGDYGWFGFYNTSFWIDPKIQLIGIILSQSYWDNYNLSKEAKNIIYADK